MIVKIKTISRRKNKVEDMTMNNTKKETISMIIFQSSALAAFATSIICLNFRNIKKKRETKKNEVVG